MARGRKPIVEGDINVEIGRSHRILSDGMCFKLERRGNTESGDGVRWGNPTWHYNLDAIANVILRERIALSRAHSVEELKQVVIECRDSVMADLLPLMDLGKKLRRIE